MIRFALLPLLLFVPACWSQTVFTTTDLDLGNLYAASERFGDLLVTNKGSKKAYILRVEKPREIVYRASSDVLLADSSFSFRLQVNPTQKGTFSYNVNIYTSDNQQPVTIRVHGNVKELPANNLAGLQHCPEFGTVPSQVEPQTLTVITVDKASNQPLAKSTVTLIRNGEPAGAWITGRKGSFSQEIVPAYFYFFALHDGYIPVETSAYIGPNIHEITIPMQLDPSISIPIAAAETAIIPEQPEKLDETEVANVLAVATVQQTDSVIRKELPALASLPVYNFDPAYFKPVNVVFVLDVSSSMKLNQKMNLMRYSLNQLASQLRAEDYITLITYSDDANVLLEPTSGDQKEKIKEQVARLKPEGLTAGGRGIKLGYKQVLKQFSPDKANMVIIITDGAFNRESDDYRKIVDKYTKKGITFSVVGIQDSERDETKMREAAVSGNGRYVPINKLSDAQVNLVQEIRIASFRGM